MKKQEHPIKGFFVAESPKEKTTSPCTTADRSFADKLATFLKDKGFLHKQMSIARESIHFKKLREVDKMSQDKIDEVLQYYCDSWDTPFLPQAYSAKGFREKFRGIEQHMKKHQKPKISKQAKEITKYLLNKDHWPKGSNLGLPEAVQLSINNYVQWLDNFNSVKEKITEQFDTIDIDWHTIDWDTIKNWSDEMRMKFYRVRRLHSYIYCLEGYFTLNPDRFIKEWFLEFLEGISNWSEWSGSLKSVIVDIKSQRFNGKFLDWTFEHYGSVSRWEELKTVMENEK